MVCALHIVYLPSTYPLLMYCSVLYLPRQSPQTRICYLAARSGSTPQVIVTIGVTEHYRMRDTGSALSATLNLSLINAPHKDHLMKTEKKNSPGVQLGELR